MLEYERRGSVADFVLLYTFHYWELDFKSIKIVKKILLTELLYWLLNYLVKFFFSGKDKLSYSFLKEVKNGTT